MQMAADERSDQEGGQATGIGAVFPRWANYVVPAAILGIIGGVPYLFVLVGFGAAPTTTDVGYQPHQPVAFSHRHHVSQLGIDCRYCHSTVEESAFAGIPATEVCMGCHSHVWTEAEELAPVRESYRTGEPITWRRVHNLAGFTYFDHSAHVNQGVACTECHGEVHRMPLVWQAESLLMPWCLDCHRNPEEGVRPRDRVFDHEWEPEGDPVELGRRLVDEYDIQPGVDCSACHR